MYLSVNGTSRIHSTINVRPSFGYFFSQKHILHSPSLTKGRYLQWPSSQESEHLEALEAVEAVEDVEDVRGAVAVPPPRELMVRRRNGEGAWQLSRDHYEGNTMVDDCWWYGWWWWWWWWWLLMMMMMMIVDDDDCWWIARFISRNKLTQSDGIRSKKPTTCVILLVILDVKKHIISLTKLEVTLEPFWGACLNFPLPFFLWVCWEEG